MPKVETVDRFRITSEISSEAVGPTLAAMTKMGLTVTGCELITDVHTYKSRTAVRHEISAEQLTAAWIETHATFEIKELVQHFKDSGRAGGSAYGAARMLVDQGALKKLGDRNYARADVKAIAAPKKERRYYDTSNDDLLLELARRKKTFTADEAQKLFGKQGRPPKSASGRLAVLVQQGAMVRVSPGVYALGGKPAPETKPSMRGRVRNEITNRALVENILHDRKTVSRDELKAWFEKHGRQLTSLRSLLAKMVEEKNIIKIGDDEFRAPTRRKPNGAAEPANTGGASHG